MFNPEITPDLGIDENGYCVDENNCPEFIERHEHDDDEEPEFD